MATLVKLVLLSKRYADKPGCEPVESLHAPFCRDRHGAISRAAAAHVFPVARDE